MITNSIRFYSDTDATEVLRLSKDGIWANPDIPADEAAKLVLEAIDYNIKVMVQKAVEDEREACANIDWTPILRNNGMVTWGDAETLADLVSAAIRARGNA